MEADAKKLILKWFTPDSDEDVAWTVEGCKVAGEWPSSPKVIRNLIIFSNKHEIGEVASGGWLETQRSMGSRLSNSIIFGVLDELRLTYLNCSGGFVAGTRLIYRRWQKAGEGSCTP